MTHFISHFNELNQPSMGRRGGTREGEGVEEEEEEEEEEEGNMIFSFIRS